MRSALIILVFAGLIGFVSACQTKALGPDDKVPPVIYTYNTVDVPNYVGKNPTQYDGRWEGLYIMEDEAMCTYAVAPVSYFTYVIMNGKFVATEGEFFQPHGFVNKAGTFMATVQHALREAELTTSGTIKGDRLTARWEEWQWGCGGRFELVRKTGNKYYCLDRLDNAPYIASTEC